MFKILLLTLLLFCNLVACVSINKNNDFTKQKSLRLKNNLLYKVIKNEDSKNSCYLRLKVKAGVLMQDPQENGMAHAIQHLAFRSPEVTNFLLKNNLSLQADDNAITNNEDTIYSLDLNNCSDDTIKEAFSVLTHFAFGIKFNDHLITKEKLILNNEQINDSSMQQEISQKMLNKLYSGTNIANNSLLGDFESRNRFNIKNLQDFYHKWYRIDNMQLLVAGDININLVNTLIKDNFNTIKKPEMKLPEISFHKPDYKHPFFIINNPDINNEIEVILSMQPKLIVQESFEQKYLKDKEIFDLVLSMINQQLIENVKNQNRSFAPEVWGKYYYGEYSEFYFSTNTKTNELKESFIKDFSIIKEALKNGFSDIELKNAIGERKKSLQNTIDEETSLNPYFVDLLLQDIENNKPTWQKEHQSFLINILDQITLKDCLISLKNTLKNGNRFLFAIGDIKEDQESVDILVDTMNSL